LRHGPAHAPVPEQPPSPPPDDDSSTLGLRVDALRAAAPRRTERPAGPTRLERLRAERARRPGPGIIASRAIGEVFITCGVLMLLFVAYQLWWTNIRAQQQANGTANQLRSQWNDGDSAGRDGSGGAEPKRKPGAFKPGEGFAIIHIPKIGIRTPIAEGVSKSKVLDKGMVGHYDTAPLKTAMPWDRKGNFALAGHRNTHGEPFRYINRLKPGDQVVVETADTYYTYKVTRQLPSTSPSNTSVIDPVPRQSGFRSPGRFVTLTTCTPEFTSKYRLIVWGKMMDERPREKGKPDAL
ncbi:class E sortase, partial [Streptomyces boncukensis]